MPYSAAHIILGIALVFTAIGLLCAVGIALRRDPVRICRRRPPAADPFFHPFGDMPGFTDAQLRAISRQPHPGDPLRRGFSHEYFDSDGLTAVVPSDQRAASAGVSSHPLGPAAVVVRKLFNLVSKVLR